MHFDARATSDLELVRCLYDMANPTDGVMNSNIINPIFEANIAALAANGYHVPSTTETNSDQNWIATRRTNLWADLAAVRPAFTNAITIMTNISTSVVVLSGLAPVEVRIIKLNGNLVPVDWTTVTNWSITTNTAAGTNIFQVIGYDRKTNTLPVRDVGGYTNSVTISR